MNDTLKILLCVFIGLTLVFGYLAFAPQVGEQTLGEYSVEPDYLGGPTHYATTTKTYAEVGAATSTMSFPCDGVDIMDMNLMLAASSTATNLIWNYQFSWDNIDWFYEDGKTLTSVDLTTHNVGTVTHSWTPGTTTEVTKNVAITPVASKYCRVNFEVIGANGDLWAVILKRIQY